MNSLSGKPKKELRDYLRIGLCCREIGLYRSETGNGPVYVWQQVSNRFKKCCIPKAVCCIPNFSFNNHNSIMPTHLHSLWPCRGALILVLSIMASSVFAQLNVNVTGTNIPCFGLSNGTATVEVTNGTPPFTYLWSNGGTTSTISNLNAGTFSVTVTDANGAAGQGSVTLTQPTRVTATITDPIQCVGPYTIAAEPQGGVVPYTYNWSTGADTRAVIVPAGDYCVTVVDANLCGYVACKSISENPPTVTLVEVDAQCNGSDDGAITANPSGGIAPYTYAWSNGQSGQTITGLAPGPYRVTLTDSRGCTATANTLIEEPGIITGSIFGDATVCPGVVDAFIRIAPSGGTPPYSYNWEPGNFTGQGVGPLGPGTYSVTVTDANECTLEDTFVITESDDVEVQITGDLLLCGANTTGTLSASPLNGPVNQYTYEWSTGATTPSISGVVAGNYSVTATDVNGCTGTATATVRTIDLNVMLSSTPTSCFDEDDGTATATASGGDQPYSYLWSNGGTTATITGLAPGVYGVTVTEANGCKASGSIQVGTPAPLQIVATPTNVVCNGESNGAIQVTVTGGTPPYTYLWSDGSTAEDRTGLAAGTYGLTVTDANGCTDNTSVTISEPPALDLEGEVTNVACNGDASGSIVVTASGGTPGYTYAWADGASGRIRNNLAAGSYTVTVTDAVGCDLVAAYTVTEPSAIMLSGVVTNLDCFGDSDGAINLTVVGGSPAYIYRWSNGANTEDISGLVAGSYRVTVTDGNDCTATTTFTITEPTDLTLSATPSNVNCGGGNDGSIAVTTSGGTQPYTYLWSNGAITEDLTGLTAGTYTLTVTDVNGCTESVSVTISEPRALNGFAQITPVACQGEATGAINLTAEFGTPPYTFLWSNGATTEDITNLAAGTYTVTITDANGCTLVQTYMVATVNPIILEGTVISVDCNGASTGGVDLTVSGGSGPYAFMWSNGTSNEDLTNVPAGTYSVTVTDSNECTDMATFTITEPDEITLSITNPDIVCGGTNSGSITVFPAGGTAPYTYLWSNGTTGNVIDDIPAGAYTVTVTDANGCTDVTAGIVLDELPELTCEVVVEQESTDGTNGVLSVNVDGGTQPYTYRWSNNATTPTISGLAAGTYSVTVTDFSGCTTECTGTLRALSGIGDFVWEDFNVNGQQDIGELVAEPGIFDYPVYLKNEGGTIIDSTRTDMDGFYSFLGLEPGTYSVLFPEAPGGIRTLANTGDDATDSDADPAMNGMTQQYTLAPGEFNMTVDAGFFAEPGGAIADPCNCLNNNTTDFDGQFTEVLEVTASPGQTWTILSNTNMFFLDSPDPPLAPIPIPVGTVIPQTEIRDGNVAVYSLEFKLVDSFEYTTVLTNGAYTLEIGNQCFYPVVRYVTEPPQEICRFDLPFLLDGFGLLNGEPLPGEVIFTVNGETVSEIDPSMLPAGENTITASFVPLDEDECIADEELIFIVVDDCPAKIGDFVWQDNNANGQQDPGEPGIEGVKAIVTSEDGTYMDMTVTDETGMYMFFVPPGTYKVTFEAPDGFLPTIGNSGNDETDSDITDQMMMTGFYTVGPDEMDLTIDAGFIVPCIANIINPGTIAASQTVCGPGNVPQPFVEIAPATGGEGEIQYLWMYNVVDPNQPITFWQAIPNSNSPNFAPGPVYETTYFTRCVRRDNCNYLESNVLTVEVGDDAVAQISGPNIVCVGEEAIFQAVNPGNGATISWNFTGSSSVESATTPTVSTTWATFGSFSATLTVTRNGCTSTRVFNVAVVNNPNRCGGNLTANGSVNNLQSREVSIEWQVPYDGSDYAFELERSVNGTTFFPVANVTVPAFVSGNDMAMFRQNDFSPLAGRTFYRVRMIDPVYGDMMSNVVELQLAGYSTSLGRIFPNPARDGMIHVEMTDAASNAGDVSIQLIDIRGNEVGPRTFLEPGSGVINLPSAQMPAGVYFVRMIVGDQTETHRVIIN